MKSTHEADDLRGVKCSQRLVGFAPENFRMRLLEDRPISVFEPDTDEIDLGDFCTKR